jgi:hypothetical protein
MEPEKLTYQKVDPSKDFIEVLLKSRDDFLIIMETLTRMGVASMAKKELYQTAHILHKQGKYYLVHFKQMFALDGKPTNFDTEDKSRLMTIAKLLKEWNLVEFAEPAKVDLSDENLSKKLKVISATEKKNWTLKPKYNIGNKKR